MATNADQIFQKHRLTVEEYHRMGEAGILKQQEHVELIEGEIIDISPIGSNHAGTVNYLNKMLNAALRDKAIISARSPIILGDRNEPEPDILVLKPRDDFYRQAHPTNDDVFFLIEVADTSLRYDREIKIPLYAKYHIPEVWLVDLEKNQLTRFSSPENSHYKSETRVTDCSEVAIQQLPNTAVNLL